MSWLTGVIGQGIAGSLGNMAQQNAAQASQYGGLAQNQQAYAQQQAMAAQQAYGANMSAGTMNHQPHHQPHHQPPQWMFNGTFMSFMDFVNTVFPEDTAEKTAFVLKWSNDETN